MDIKEGEGSKKILHPDWMPQEEIKWDAIVHQFDEGKNPRLVLSLNMPMAAPFFSILEIKGMPPIAVCVVRADKDVIALGVLEKLKIMVHQLQRRLSIGSKLSVGVTDVALDPRKLRDLKAGKA